MRILPLVLAALIVPLAIGCEVHWHGRRPPPRVQPCVPECNCGASSGQWYFTGSGHARSCPVHLDWAERHK